MSDPSPVILDAAAVRALLPEVDTLAIMRSLFFEIAEGTAVQPSQSLSLFPEGKGDPISYLGTLAKKGVFGVKLSPYIVTADRPIMTAWTTLMSTSTGQPVALCDAGLLTVADSGDDKATTPNSAGEMVLATRAGTWSSDKVVGDLAELVAGKCPRPTGGAPVFFRSIGLGSKTSRWRRQSCVHRKR